MSVQYVYTIQQLKKVYPGGKEVLKNINLSFLPGAKIGVLGINGSGKSSLMKIIAGIDKEFSGEAWPAEGFSIGYLPQEPILNEECNVVENVMSGLGEAKQLVDEFNTVSAKFSEVVTDEEMNELINKQAELQEKIDALDAWDLERKAEIAMDALRLPPSNSSVNNLSGGEKRRIALCKLLLSSPDILLLDEPTNHLDAETVSWLQRFLHDFKNTVITVTHDRYFLDEVAGWILELDRGNGIPYKGNYSGWLEQKEKRLELEGKTEIARQKTLSEELEWVKSAPKARQAKSKARLNAYDELFKKNNENISQQSRYDIVINCSGSSGLNNKNISPLLNQLKNSGLCTPTSSNHGFIVGDNFDVLPGLYINGPLLAGNVVGDMGIWHVEHCGRIISFAKKIAKIIIENDKFITNQKSIL